MRHKDWRGTEIVIGSKFIYSTNQGSSVTEAEVVEVIDGNADQNRYLTKRDDFVADYYERFLFKLRVQPLRQTSWFEPDQSKRAPVVLHCVDRVTVIG